MLDLDYLVDLRWKADVDSPRSKKALETAIRQNQKVLLEATHQSIEYVTQRDRLGSSFESLFRSLGLGAGVLVGGPIGAASIGAITAGVGRGVGEYFGNKIYGKSINKLEQVQSNYKYQQLINNSVLSETKAQISLNDEFYKQASEEVTKTITDLGGQQ
jgi:uncharacterized protein (DUF697 family)